MASAVTAVTTGPRVISLLLVSAPEIYLSLVVPVRNGADRLAVHLEALRAFVCAQARPAELILVDDCSESAAAQLLAEFGRDAAETGERVTLLRNQENRGKGFSVARGIRAARGRYRAFTDADLAYPLEEIPKIVRDLETGSDAADMLRHVAEVRWNDRRGRYA